MSKIENIENYHPNGKLKEKGTHKDRLLIGLLTYWYESGQKSIEGTYKDGKENGLFTNWYESGQTSFKGTYIDGKKDGLFTTWYENGQKKYEYSFKKGKENGLYTSWFNNGEKRGERIYVDGFIDDLKGWNIYGQINRIYLYKNGLPHGKHIDIDEDGGKRIEYYEFGEKIYIEKLDKNGRQISYKEGDRGEEYKKPYYWAPFIYYGREN